MCDWCGNDFTDDEPEYEEGMHEHCYDEWLEETEDDDDGR